MASIPPADLSEGVAAVAGAGPLPGAQTVEDAPVGDDAAAAAGPLPGEGTGEGVE